MTRLTRRTILTSTAAALSAGCGRNLESAVAARSGGFTHLLEGIGRENIKITGVKVTRLGYTAPKGQFVLEAGPSVSMSSSLAILQVFTDKGIVGVGPGGGFGAAAAGGAADYSYLIGQNPFDVELIGLSGGLDIACWDIIGKAKGLPVYKLLATDNQPNPKVHVYASAGVNWTFYDRGDGRPYGVDALIEEALRFKEMGFDIYKWRPGTDWEAAGMTAEKMGNVVCRKLREAVGPDFKLAIEKKANDSWTYEEATTIAPIINDLNFYWFEQPFRDEGPAQFEDYTKLKSLMPKVMLFGGENFRGVDMARPFLTQRIYNACQADTLSLGVTQNWYVARLAAFHGIKVVPHNWASALGTMCNTHLVAGVPSGFLCEYFMYPNTPWRDALFKEPMVPKNGYITLNDKPGFGMELNDLTELSKKYPYDSNSPRGGPNPRFPEAAARALAREASVRAKYIQPPQGIGGSGPGQRPRQRPAR